MKRSPAERVAALLLWLYPPAFRRAFGREVLQHVRAEAARRSTARVVPRLIADGLASAVREWSARISLSPSPFRRRGAWMRDIMHDIRFAGRMLRLSPGFAMAAVATLALGIGANAAIIGLADATLVRPLPVRDPASLVVWSWSSSYPHYAEYAKRTDVFDGVVATGGGSRLNVTIDGAAELAPAIFVSGNAFDLLGIAPEAGRTFHPSDDAAGAPMTVVLNHRYWMTRFGGELSAIGRPLRINGRPATIIGVAREGFRGTTLASNPALYLTLSSYPQVSTGFFSRVNPLTTPGFVWLNVIGRLRQDVSLEEAASAIDALYTHLQPPRAGLREERLQLEPIMDRALGRSAGEVSSFVALLLGVAGLTLLVGCANLANLLLARGAARHGEIGIRLAVGATRGRVVRQLLVESLVLSTLGAVGGVLVAHAVLRVLGRYQLPGGLDIQTLALSVNTTTLLVSLGLGILTGCLFGLIPAWRASRTDLVSPLRGISTATTPRTLVRSALLGAQVAFSLVLLTGAGLFARSLSTSLNIPLGFVPDRVVTASVNLGLARYEQARAAQFYGTALERITALPQVQAAAWGNLIPTRGLFMGEAEVEQTGNSVTVYGTHVGPDYFRVIGSRIVDGRAFTSADSSAAPLVAIVNAEMARTKWPGRSAVGGRVRMFDQWLTVVGVAENTVVRTLGERPVPQIYLAFHQWLTGSAAISTDSAHLFVRTRDDDPAAVLPLIREQLRGLDAELPLYDLGRFDERVASLLMPQRMGVVLLSFFSLLAVTLASVGIYGVATYVAALRTREIGIRLALGATPGSLRWLVLGTGARPVLAGLVAGLISAVFLSQTARAFLMNVSPLDPVAYVCATLVLLALSLFASYVPARRAARTDPLRALRVEG